MPRRELRARRFARTRSRLLVTRYDVPRVDMARPRGTGRPWGHLVHRRSRNGRMWQPREGAGCTPARGSVGPSPGPRRAAMRPRGARASSCAAAGPAGPERPRPSTCVQDSDRRGEPCIAAPGCTIARTSTPHDHTGEAMTQNHGRTATRMVAGRSAAPRAADPMRGSRQPDSPGIGTPMIGLRRSRPGGRSRRRPCATWSTCQPRNRATRTAMLPPPCTTPQRSGVPELRAHWRSRERKLSQPARMP